MEYLSYLLPLLQPQVLGAIALGTLGGIVIGALPGLTATMGVALLIPLTFGMAPVMGINMLIGIYIGGIYGGCISAILLRTPGTPASAATVLDGYPMAQKGEAGKALGMATIASAIGTLFASIVLATLAPQLASIALKFGAPGIFRLVTFRTYHHCFTIRRHPERGDFGLPWRVDLLCRCRPDFRSVALHLRHIGLCFRLLLHAGLDRSFRTLGSLPQLENLGRKEDVAMTVSGRWPSGRTCVKAPTHWCVAPSSAQSSASFPARAPARHPGFPITRHDGRRKSLICSARVMRLASQQPKAQTTQSAQARSFPCLRSASPATSSPPF